MFSTEIVLVVHCGNEVTTIKVLYGTESRTAEATFVSELEVQLLQHHQQDQPRWLKGLTFMLVTLSLEVA